MASPVAAPALPRVTIQFCTQCKWMLRAAYYAQELLSTFSQSLGEVALQPSTAGTFVVAIHYSPLRQSQQQSAGAASPAQEILWDRRVDGGFPETKELKRRVRDILEPSRDLGHVDRHRARDPICDTAEPSGSERDRGVDPGQGTDSAKDECQDCAP